MASGAYTLNGNDLWTVYGLLVEGGSGSFLAFPARKDSLQHDFRDRDGLDIDLWQPRFRAREFALSCALHAPDRDAFWARHNGLFAELAASGTHELGIAELGRAFRVYYKEQRNMKKLTPLDGAPGAWLRFDLVFGEATWEDNIEKTFLVDHEGRYLVS